MPLACQNANAYVESLHTLIEYEIINIASFNCRIDILHRVTIYLRWFDILMINFDTNNKTPLV